MYIYEYTCVYRYMYVYIWTHMHTCIYFKISIESAYVVVRAKSWKQPKYPTIGDWFNELQYIYSMKDDFVIQNEVLEYYLKIWKDRSLAASLSPCFRPLLPWESLKTHQTLGQDGSRVAIFSVHFYYRVLNAYCVPAVEPHTFYLADCGFLRNSLPP